MAFLISERMKNESSHTKGNEPFQKVLPALYRYCLSLTGSIWDAEDLAQATFLHMLQSEKKLHELENGEAYLIRSARNRWIDDAGDAQRWITLGLNDMAEPIAVAGSVLYQSFYSSGAQMNSNPSHGMQARMAA
ncbi:RNA polymerase sigma factor [Paenibacillus terrae]|uniref:RNA polymerase sigma factor n=1 Tax=Paenibacillus terrae TaxID=159743 RepID=UPI0011EAF0A6|nr:sigma factor [Paenibacillus terrae]